MLRHFKEELEDARGSAPRAEEGLRARNTILFTAAAIAPLTVVMWIAILLLWDNVGEPPSLMVRPAFIYPVAAIAAAMIGLPLHRCRFYFLASVIAVLPLAAIAVFLLGGVLWAVG